MTRGGGDATPLPLHAAKLDAFHQVLLQAHKDKDHWDDGHRDRRHQQRSFLALLRVEEQQADGQGVAEGGLEHDQRPEEVLVRAHEGEDGKRDQAWPAERHDDFPEYLPFAGPVDLRRLIERAGDAHHKLPQKEGAERAERGWNDKPEVRVHQSEMKKVTGANCGQVTCQNR